jgi:hypothetical protein
MKPNTENQQIDSATYFSMSLSLILVIVAVWKNISWQMTLGMLLSGLALQAASNLICIPLLKPAVKGKSWAIWAIQILKPVVLIALSIYFAGAITLIIQLIRSFF